MSLYVPHCCKIRLSASVIQSLDLKKRRRNDALHNINKLSHIIMLCESGDGACVGIASSWHSHDINVQQNVRHYAGLTLGSSAVDRLVTPDVFIYIIRDYIRLNDPFSRVRVCRFDGVIFKTTSTILLRVCYPWSEINDKQRERERKKKNRKTRPPGATITIVHKPPNGIVSVF